MILLDTNVIPALMQREPDGAVELVDGAAADAAGTIAASRQRAGLPVAVRDG